MGCAVGVLIVLAYNNIGQRSVASTISWTLRNIASHSGTSWASFLLMGPQCFRKCRRPIAANSAANAGHSFDSR